MIMRLIRKRLLREAQRAHILFKLFAIRAIEKPLRYLTDKVAEELLVVDPVVCQIAQHVQLLLGPVQLEEVGIEGDKVMSDDSH